jgi:hypothetical protein
MQSLVNPMPIVGSSDAVDDLSSSDDDDDDVGGGW